MAFRLKADAPIGREVRRIVLRQLDLARSELTSIGDPESDEAIHDARRRVKKIRAILRLIRPVLDKAFRAADPDLRRVSKMLAPVADGKGVIDTLNTLARRYRKSLPRSSVAALRADLLDREARVDAQAARDHILEKASSALLAHREEVKSWRLSTAGFRAVAPGLQESARRARNAMVATWKHPTAAHFHAWRRHVKAHWFHVRLLEAHCGNHLMPLQRRLEALDGILGEYHNLVLLREVLVADSALSRQDAAGCMRVVANYQRVLRQNAQAVGLRIYSEKPRVFVRRVRHYWRATAAHERRAHGDPP